MTRVTPRLPRTTGAVQCSRCLDLVDVRAGHWIAGEHDGPAAVCARCARPTAISTGSSTRDPWAS